jgi:glyoxylase-like metal-dependent hydrolase (beta-lactamase superfamily II)
MRVRVIDCMHLGRARVIGCFLLGDVLIDPGPSSCLPTVLEALGDLEPRALLLTHIHLDHAGASGSLVRRWPSLEVYVHERGARHMADPSRLLASATQLYGAQMGRLWGEFVPVPQERLRVLRGGESLRVGDLCLEVAYTPGHASHHVSYLHGATAFVGDVAGVRIGSRGPVIPPTPPPDIDVQAWKRSLELIASWRPERLAVTHFGVYDDPGDQLAELDRRLDSWAQLARDHDFAGFEAGIIAELRATADESTLAAYAQAAPRDQLYAGLRRYWERRRGAGGERSGAGAERASKDDSHAVADA